MIVDPEAGGKRLPRPHGLPLPRCIRLRRAQPRLPATRRRADRPPEQPPLDAGRWGLARRRPRSPRRSIRHRHRGVRPRHPLWGGSSETAAVASALLSDLVERGLDVEQGLLFVLDGSKRAALGPIRKFSFIRRRGCRNRRLGSSVDRADNLFPVGRRGLVTRAASSRLPVTGVAEDPRIVKLADELDDIRYAGDGDPRHFRSTMGERLSNIRGVFAVTDQAASTHRAASPSMR